MRPTAILGMVVCAATLAIGCDEKLSDVAGPSPNLQPTFSSIQTDIFSARDAADRRACTECHNARFAAFNGGLNLEGAAAYANLVGRASRDKPGATRVIAGDPEGSYLMQKLEGAPGIVGARMPQIPPYLTPGQIRIIRRWIELGAQNN